jgi:cell division protein FtsB
MGQLGVFGLILAVLVVFVFLWMRESRAVRTDTETAIARKARDLERKNAEIAELHDEVRDLKQALRESEARERALYSELMECRYPELKNHGPEKDT